MARSSAGPTDFQEIAHAALSQRYEMFVWARLAVAPFIAGLAVWIAVVDSAVWRQVVLFLAAAGLVTISTWDAYWLRRTRDRPRIPFLRNAVAAAFASVVIVFVTGGLESPFVPVIVIIALMETIFVSPRLGHYLVLGFQIPAVWGLAVVSVYDLVPGLIPDLFRGTGLEGHSGTLLWVQALVLTAVLLGVTAFGSRLRASYDRMLESVIEERDALLRAHAAYSHALTTLSGEIAHELKNPLASVKGLAALVAKDLEGSSAERMSVLRREVDRMQSVLGEFLNFTRPIVPLSQEEVDLVDLCREVGALHEGVAREKGVVLGVRAEGEVRCTCDPRKVQRVLINLLQNAIEASPPGNAVVIDVAPLDAERVRVQVVDQGPGLPNDLVDRVFDAGVTTKPSGSGLGLTVARALAVQHGGELSIANREEGGCAAELRLPRSGAASAGAPAQGGDE